MYYGHYDHCGPGYVNPYAGYPYTGYPYAGYHHCGYGHNFALIVVLFILLIIIGACYVC
ncbi:YjcZ family sporulation protein [Bacillus songklensis]|uniref:YjcZ family sporulation protein n=1 Tax=Bacillus songklensis TaxID=1069116 RepID=A0ABV8B791_9BACI